MKPMSIRTQLLAFAFVAVLSAMGLSFAITLALPPPPESRTNIAEVAWALQGRRSWVVSTQRRPLPPQGPRSELLERAIARELAISADGVRATWLDLPDGSSGRGEAVLRIDERDVLVDANKRGFEITYGDAAVLRPGTLLPLFVAATRQPDGGWLWATPDDPARTAWTRRIAVSFLIGFAFILPLAALVANLLSRPVRLLGRVAETASEHDVDPFPAQGPRDLRVAAAAMNAMHNRLREQSNERIRALGGLAHDLRTPLTALRLRAEALPAKARGAIRADLDRMAELLDAMLGGALIGAYEPVFVPTDLAALARECAASAASGTDEVAIGAMAPIDVVTDPILARRLIGNIVENAIRYGKHASISVDVVETRGRVIVVDSGRGIAPERIADATRAFVRLEPEADPAGTGLGLSIASEIARMLDVQLDLSDAQPGLRVAMTFPTAAQG